MSQRAVGAWMFGKMPSLGDFVARGLGQQARAHLDAWLSQEMEAARTAAGDGFEARYDAAPAWNFVECDDDGQWSGGALCASQDRAGRRFPLIMAVAADDASAAAAFSEGCLATLCQAFAEGWDPDQLVASVVVPQQDSRWQPKASEWALLADDGPAMVLPGRYPQGVISRMVEMAQ
ncbi:MAG: type VI secretion system-associated protein TagF [Novosphingobium sp.]